MVEVLLKSIMDGAKEYLKSPAGKAMLRQVMKMLPSYLHDLQISFQQTYTKVNEVSSEGKTVI